VSIASVIPIRAEMIARLMNDPDAAGLPRLGFNPTARGYAIGYRTGEVNNCPGCGRCNWWVRTMTAECAFCSTAVPVLL
jgi:hypothetical protein